MQSELVVATDRHARRLRAAAAGGVWLAFGGDQEAGRRGRASFVAGGPVNGEGGQIPAVHGEGGQCSLARPHAAVPAWC